MDDRGLLPTEWIWTPTGPKEMRSLRLGDTILGGDGQPCEVLAIMPKRRQPVYRLTLTDGGHVVCDGGHLWKCRTPSMRRMGLSSWITVPTSELEAKPIVGNLACIPTAPGLALVADPPPLDPYLVGRWAAGDITALGRRDVLAITNNLDGRWIPDIYTLGTNQTRLEVLRGVCDSPLAELQGGGTVVAIRLASGESAATVGYLARSVGMLAIVRGRGKDWRVLVSSAKHNPFGKSRNQKAFNRIYEPVRDIWSIEHIGSSDTMCLNVSSEDNTFICGPGASLMVTHNASQPGYIGLD